VQGEVLSEKVVWQMLRPYATAASVPGVAPHDCRRTAAKLCRAPKPDRGPTSGIPRPPTSA
jgi:hypothetical protein